MVSVTIVFVNCEFINSPLGTGSLKMVLNCLPIDQRQIISWIGQFFPKALLYKLYNAITPLVGICIGKDMKMRGLALLFLGSVRLYSFLRPEYKNSDSTSNLALTPAFKILKFVFHVFTLSMVHRLWTIDYG